MTLCFILSSIGNFAQLALKLGSFYWLITTEKIEAEDEMLVYDGQIGACSPGSWCIRGIWLHVLKCAQFSDCLNHGLTTDGIWRSLYLQLTPSFPLKLLKTRTKRIYPYAWPALKYAPEELNPMATMNKSRVIQVKIEELFK